MDTNERITTIERGGTATREARSTYLALPQSEERKKGPSKIKQRRGKFSFRKELGGKYQVFWIQGGASIRYCTESGKKEQ